MRKRSKKAKGKKKMDRDYDFNLPIHISYFQATMVPALLKSKGIWEDIPDSLQDKIYNTPWSGLDITREDLDCLDNRTYYKLLSWVQDIS